MKDHESVRHTFPDTTESDPVDVDGVSNAAHQVTQKQGDKIETQMSAEEYLFPSGSRCSTFGFPVDSNPDGPNPDEVDRHDGEHSAKDHSLEYIEYRSERTFRKSNCTYDES